MIKRDDELIDYANMALGMYFCFKNVQKYFTNGKIFHAKEKYQSAIFNFIMCVEESYKVSNLAMHVRKDKSITNVDWRNLTNHDYKFTYMNNFYMETLKNISKEKRDDLVQSIYGKNVKLNFEQLVPYIKIENDIISNFQHLKELCVYQYWNNNKKQWFIIDNLTLEEKENLLFYVMTKSLESLTKCRFEIEHAINIMRRKGGKITSVVYPTYDEHREPKNYETKIYVQTISDIVKYNRGESILKSILKNNSKNISNELIFIDPDNVCKGAYLCLKNSKRHFMDAIILYRKKRFHSAIPSFILCIEESIKAQALSIKSKSNEFISHDEWANLTNHHYKLNHYDNSKKIFESIFRENGISKKNITMNNFLKYEENAYDNKQDFKIISNLQKLKKACMYQNWKSKYNEWDDFSKLKKNQKSDLAFFIMKRASLELNKSCYLIEHVTNILRKNKMKLINVEYPKYNECRKPENYISKLSIMPKINNFPKYYRGEKIFFAFNEDGTFAVIDQIFRLDVVQNCLKILQKDDSNDWHPHPLISSIISGLQNVNDKPNGLYVMNSDDTDLTLHEQSKLYCTSIIKKADNILTIEEIIINGDRYVIYDKILERILKTEMYIDAQSGSEISIDTMHKACNTIGFKIHILKNNEIESAISTCKLKIQRDEIYESSEIINDMKNITLESWNTAKLITQLTICCHGLDIFSKSNIVFTQFNLRSMKKYPIRLSIYELLKNIHGNINL